MGCNTSALATPAPVIELAQWLRSRRQLSGLSYRQMAAKATTDPHQPVPHLRFYHADRGRKLPAWQVVESYVRVCGADERQAERLWKKAETATAAPGSPAARRRPVLAPEFIGEPIELLDAMRAMRFSHGNRSLRELDQAAGLGLLPRSTLGAVLSGKRMPSKDLLMVFVRVCGGVRPGTPKAMAWEQAWTRADAHRRGLFTDMSQHDHVDEEARQDAGGADMPLRSATGKPGRTWRRRVARMLHVLAPRPDARTTTPIPPVTLPVVRLPSPTPR
ncbi:helix-turn-helix domain-containing protein [Streptomyces chryseus]|uniref:helix-turn-helix domain-containing protein n=1 Tax=Streptomyces chryseus TaxID=68186 RepID=UPI00110FABE3|nr:helix-turn-helix domain-containing protein [Streptomyces chryseus]